MMTIRRVLVVAVAAGFVLVQPSQAPGYGYETHRALGGEAYVRAGLDQRISSYGLLPGQPLPGRWLSLRWGPLKPRDWVKQGALDEDIPVNRVLNHFYDPYFDRGLTTPLLNAGIAAPVWALEEEALASQNHSYRDAREAFYNGLTWQSRVERERELGHTFYALGHVIHLIQDVTVPEHARNDAHLPLGNQASLAEGYLEDNRAAFLPTDSAVGVVAGMPVVALPHELWTNPAGTGIAQFTNAHFVSPDTNFDRAETGATGGEYPSPVLDLVQARVESPGGCRNGTEPVRAP